MAHFAEIDENNIVLRVVVIPDEEEHRGQEYLAEDMQLGGTWLKTSYNTRFGEHTLGGTPFRKNFAAPGDRYDPDLDAFIVQAPFPSWVDIDTEKGIHIAPKPKPATEPTDPFTYIWNEELLDWEKFEFYQYLPQQEL